MFFYYFHEYWQKEKNDNVCFSSDQARNKLDQLHSI